jgi:hypothetical protein
MTRREWLGAVSAGALAMAAPDPGDDLKIYFGDLHSNRWHHLRA